MSNACTLLSVVYGCPCADPRSRSLLLSVTAQKRACNTATCVTHRLAHSLSRSGGMGRSGFIRTDVGPDAFGRRRRRRSWARERGMGAPPRLWAVCVCVCLCHERARHSVRCVCVWEREKVSDRVFSVPQVNWTRATHVPAAPHLRHAQALVLSMCIDWASETQRNL